MHFGVATFPTDQSVAPDDLARMCEERGFESLFFAEHTHIPSSRETSYPAGGELPEEYRRLMDPFVALTAAATVTKTLKVGTGLCLVIERDPILTAKEAATLDVLSGGRVLFGVGAGWNLEEMRNHGTDPRRRFGLMRERVEAIKEIWTSDEATYHGRHVDFDPIWSWPKPVQDPHPPVLVGGNGKTVYDRVIAFGDAWIPNYLGDVERLAGRMESLQAKAAEAGRDRIPVTIYGVPRNPAAFETWAEAGTTRCLFYLQAKDTGSREAAEARLDKFAAAAEEYRGAG
ncbi:MAG: LLM class F420-dependent oxidoreductase [Actinomycetota bacterium]|nr:LLM class F420-dependent oxidoreductase [Actinomycetota bacterium]